MGEFPRFLYKYKSFSMASLDSLICNKVYLSDPSVFNDPLDCNPYIHFDIKNNDELKDLLRKILYKESVREYKYKFESLRFDFDEKTEFNELIETHSLNYTEGFLLGVESLFDGSGDIITDIYSDLIRMKLKERVNKGVLSLSESYDCPLMWSHYADQHNGYCIGYKVPSQSPADAFYFFNNIKRVDYDAERLINISQIKNMILGDTNAESNVDDAIYYRKAKKWEYEKEYRMIGMKGLIKSPFELAEITFGVRCNESVKYSIINALNRKYKEIRFYSMKIVDGSFDLVRIPISLSDFDNYPL